MSFDLQPVLSANAQTVLANRYLHKNEKGEATEVPRDMFERVARAIADGDAEYGEDPHLIAPTFYEMMVRGLFLPNTPCLANAGRPGSTGQLAACFVLPVDDDMRSIMGSVSAAAFIQQSGGGTGFSFSRLRPNGDFVRSTSGVASGPISFMSMFNSMTEHVKQGGIRRGANMGILRVDHPDILEFIDCKRKACAVCASQGAIACDHSIKNFNISVGITDAFMAALGSLQGSYDLVNPRTGLVTGKLQARAVWARIVDNAHFSGEPGLCFLDRVNRLDPLTAALGPIEATNPCGEVPLRAYDACTLGSINLSNFYVRNPKKACGTIDFDQLRTIVYHAIHFLDNVLTVNKFPVPKIAEMTRTCRKVGLGVMGWADLLIKLDIPYDSQPAIDLAEQVGRFVNTEAVAASEYLAEIRGPFAHWSKSAWALRGDKPRRNATATVIAPTGSISIIAGCSSGIEPLFALKMKRNHAVLQADDSCALFDEHVRVNYEGAQLSSVLEWVAEHGTVRDCPHAMAETAALFPTAMGIDGDWHVRMQAAWQQHVEDAVSKTINLPKTATPEDVARSYQMAWDLGCKGITVYRDGSRQQQVLSAGSGQSAVASVAPLWARTHRRVPEDGWREGPTISRPTAFGSVHTTINTHPDDGEPFECFASLGRGGSEVTAFAAALGRANSLLLSIPSPLSPRDRLALLAAQLKGIGGTQNGYGDKKTASIPDAISQAISQYLARYSVVVPVKQALDICPDCKQATLAKGGKCDVCTSCGFSKC